MNRELYSFCLKSCFSFSKLSFSLFWVVKSVLTIGKIHACPLITKGWKLFHHHSSKVFAICLYKIRFDKDVTHSRFSCLFTIQLSCIIRTINGKTQRLTKIFVKKSCFRWWLLLIIFFRSMTISLTINVNTNTFYSGTRLCVVDVIFILFGNFRIIRTCWE